MSPLLEALRAAKAQAVPAGEVDEVLGLLLRLQAALIHPGRASARDGDREAAPADAGGDEVWLTAEDAALKLHRSREWVYRHARRWSFVHRPTRRTLLISQRGLDAWLKRK